MDNSPPPNAEEYVTPPPRSTYPMLTSPAAPIAPRVFNMAQDENRENESETSRNLTGYEFFENICEIPTKFHQL